MLPVLKEAGVVDSGGAGFIKIIEGWVMALEGKILDAEKELQNVSSTIATTIGAHNLGDIEIKYGYCTEFIVQLFKPDQFDEKIYERTTFANG